MKIPCPLSPEQCAALAELEERIPMVQQIVQECEADVCKIPGAATSLANALAAVKGARALLARHFDTPSQS
jgi:hypothetical protein